MIDTVTLKTENLRFNPSGYGLKIKKMQRSNAESYKYFFNNPASGSSIEIITNVREDGISSEPVLFYTASLPNLIYENNLQELSANDFDQVCDAIHNDLRSSTVSTNATVDKFSVTRVDFCKNIFIENDIKKYFDVLNTQNISRRTLISWKNQTLLWKSKKKEFMIYNKILELKNKGFNVQGKSENVLRFESRLKSSEAIKSELKNYCPLLKELYKNNLKFNSPTLIDLFNPALSQKQLLNDFKKFKINDIKTVQLHKLNDSQLFDHLHEKNTRYLRHEFIKLRGFEYMLKKYKYNTDEIEALFKSRLSRASTYKFMNEFKLYMNQTRPFISALSKELTEKIIDELDQKLSLAA